MPPICSMKADLGVAKKYYCPKKSHAKFAEFRKDYAGKKFFSNGGLRKDILCFARM